MLSAWIGKEIRELVRDGRFRAVALAVMALLLLSLGLGLRRAALVSTERQDANRIAEEHFRTQDDKNPHIAAHYGKYVFKPAGLLSYVNPGVDTFVGSSTKLEAHKRNAFAGAQAADGTALSRFGRMSVSYVLEVLLPLLIVAMGFSAWTAERERGTLRQVMSYGVSSNTLLLGKLGGLIAALGLVLIPALFFGAMVAVFIGLQEAVPLGRLGLMLVVYFFYALCWGLLAHGVSASAKNSRSSLLVLIGLWVMFSLAMPRVIPEAASSIAPVPGAQEFKAAVAHSLEMGLAGQTQREERIEEISQELLERHGFKGAEMLMDASLLNGIELQAEAQFENEVFDHHFADLDAKTERSERVSQWLALFSPVAAARSLSAALSGTDAAHHRHFSAAAERHRRELIEMLNQEFAERGGALGFDYKAGKELWERAPPFRYSPPTLAQTVRSQLPSAIVLLGWLVLAAIGAVRAVRRIQVV